MAAWDWGRPIETACKPPSVERPTRAPIDMCPEPEMARRKIRAWPDQPLIGVGHAQQGS
jgi:hypothetical protein